MDQKELERLVAILGNDKNNYRGSPVTQAAEVRKIIQEQRPDLYEHLVAEEKRKEEEPNKNNSLVEVPLLENSIELESYLPKLDTSYKFPKQLENQLIVNHQEQVFVYEGKITISSFKADDHLWGNAELTKYIRETNNKKKVKLFPPRVELINVCENKKLWDLNSYSIVFSKTWENFSERGCFKELIKGAKKERMIVPESLLSTVFNPIYQQLKEIYNKINCSA